MKFNDWNCTYLFCLAKHVLSGTGSEHLDGVLMEYYCRGESRRMSNKEMERVHSIQIS